MKNRIGKDAATPAAKRKGADQESEPAKSKTVIVRVRVSKGDQGRCLAHGSPAKRKATMKRFVRARRPRGPLTEVLEYRTSKPVSVDVLERRYREKQRAQGIKTYIIPVPCTPKMKRVCEALGISRSEYALELVRRDRPNRRRIIEASK